MEDDIYIKVLKFAQRRGLKGVSYKEFCEEFGEDKKAIWISALKSQGLTIDHDNNSLKTGEHPGTFTSYYVLSFDARFKLMDYEQLQDARASSSSAKTLSLFAIGVSVIALIVSICFSYKTLVTPIKIDNTQFTNLIKNQSVEQVVIEARKSNSALDSLVELGNITLNKLQQQNEFLRDLSNESTLDIKEAPPADLIDKTAGK